MRGMGSSESKNNKSRSEAALIAGLLLPGSAKWLRGRDLNPRPLGYELKDLTDRLLPSLIYVDFHPHWHCRQVTILCRSYAHKSEIHAWNIECLPAGSRRTACRSVPATSGIRNCDEATEALES